MAPLPPAAERPPVMANLRFAQHLDALVGREPVEIFTYLFDTDVEGSRESGTSDVLHREIPALLRALRARTLLDAPCGDGSLARVDLGRVDYTGADIVPALVTRNAQRYAAPRRRFVRLNLIDDPLPHVDVVLCRDCLMYLNYFQIFKIFRNLRHSRSRYLLTTTFVELDANADVDTGDWRALNLCEPPFRLPAPDALIMEGCPEVDGAYADRALGLWKIADLPDLPR